MGQNFMVGWKIWEDMAEAGSGLLSGIRGTMYQSHFLAPISWSAVLGGPRFTAATECQVSLYFPHLWLNHRWEGSPGEYYQDLTGSEGGVSSSQKCVHLVLGCGISWDSRAVIGMWQLSSRNLLWLSEAQLHQLLLNWVLWISWDYCYCTSFSAV